MPITVSLIGLVTVLIAYSETLPSLLFQTLAFKLLQMPSHVQIVLGLRGNCCSVNTLGRFVSEARGPGTLALGSDCTFDGGSRAGREAAARPVPRLSLSLRGLRFLSTTICWNWPESWMKQPRSSTQEPCLPSPQGTWLVSFWFLP